MIPPTAKSSTASSSLDASTTTIIIECIDFRRDTGLLLLKRKKDDKFELHLHSDYTNDAIAMILSIEDLAKMFESLEEYFIKAQIESYFDES